MRASRTETRGAVASRVVPALAPAGATSPRPRPGMCSTASVGGRAFEIQLSSGAGEAGSAGVAVRSLAALRCLSCAQSPAISSRGTQSSRGRGRGLAATWATRRLSLSLLSPHSFPPSATKAHTVSQAMSTPEQVAQNYSFSGTLTKYKGTAHSLGGLETQFNVFLPEQALKGEKVP